MERRKLSREFKLEAVKLVREQGVSFEHGRSPKSAIVRLSLGLATVGFSLLFALCVTEVVLRIFPSLISVPVLEHFNSGLRRSVADKLNLSTKSSRRIIPSSERHDGGPDFYIFEPNRTLIVPVDPNDAQRGGIETVHVDSWGFCNPASAASRAKVDVLILGDSFTFCTAVRPEDTSSAQLEIATGLSTYNLGIPGIGPFEYVELLRMFGLSKNPKFVVMNIYEGNDIRDADRFNDYVVHGRQSMDADSMAGPFAWSYALAFIKAAIEQQVREWRRSTGLDFRYTVGTPAGNMPMNIANQDRDEVNYSSRLVSGQISPTVIEPALNTFIELAKVHDFVPLVSFIPSAHTAYAKSVSFNDEEVGRVVKAGSVIQREWLRNFAFKNGITFIDLASVFQEAREMLPISHFPVIVHLTPEGHRLVADEIAKSITHR